MFRMCPGDEGLGTSDEGWGPCNQGEMTILNDKQLFLSEIRNNFQDYVVANYCPKLDEEDQPMCEEYYGMAYVWMLVCTLVF